VIGQCTFFSERGAGKIGELKFSKGMLQSTSSEETMQILFDPSKVYMYEDVIKSVKELQKG